MLLKTDTPEVSVIIPVFNAELYIENAIDSLNRQSLSNIEIIAVDDASTDATSSILNQKSCKDERIRVTRMERNSGPGASRNRGLALARGSWIALLDADDTFEPDRLETLVRIGEQKNADVVADNVLLCYDSAKTSQLLIQAGKADTYRTLQLQEFIEGCTLFPGKLNRGSYVFMHPIFKRSFLQRFNISYSEVSRNGEDLMFYLDCFVAGSKWHLSLAPGYRYHIRDGSLTEIVSREDGGRIIRRIRQLLNDPMVQRDAALSRAVTAYWKSMADVYYYWGFKDAVRDRDINKLIKVVFADRASLLFILKESLARAPAIIGRLFHV